MKLNIHLKSNEFCDVLYVYDNYKSFETHFLGSNASAPPLEPPRVFSKPVSRCTHQHRTVPDKITKIIMNKHPNEIPNGMHR